MDRLFPIGGGGLVRIFLFLLKSETVGERSLSSTEVEVVEEEEQEPLTLDSIRGTLISTCNKQNMADLRARGQYSFPNLCTPVFLKKFPDNVWVTIGQAPNDKVGKLLVRVGLQHR